MKKIKLVTLLLAAIIPLSLFAACKSNSTDTGGTESTATEATDTLPDSASESDIITETNSESNSESKSEQSSATEGKSETESEPDTETETYPEPDYTVEERYFIFRIWNFDILSLNEFKSIVDRVALDGFNAIKIHIPWHHVETVSGIYNYSAFDPMLDYVINEKGLKVAVSVDFTRKKGDAVLSEEHIMRNADGNLCIGGSAPSDRMQISFNSEYAVQKATDFYYDLVSHYDSLFGNGILFYLPAFSQYAESEYWCNSIYDYSSHAKEAFRSFLKDNYGTVDVLNFVTSSSYSSFNDVLPPETITSDNMGQLWYIFRHKSLKAVIDMLSDTQKKAAPNSKFALQFGSVWDSNSFLRGTLGFVDLCEKADVLWVDDGPLTNHRFSMDYLITAMPQHIELAQEIDGPYHSVATPELYLQQGLQCFERGAKYMSIANWSINADYERYSYAWREIANTWLGENTPNLIRPTSSSPTIEISLLELFRVRNITSIQQRYTQLTSSEEAARIVIKDDLTNAIPTQPEDFYSFPGGFSDVQGAGGWYYKNYLNGIFSDMTYDKERNVWQGASTYTLIGRNSVHPDAHDAAVVFKAPKDGEITIKICCIPLAEKTDGISFFVLHNNSPLILKNGIRRATVSWGEALESTITLSVKHGDNIAFVVNRNTNNLYDSTDLSIYITYH